MAYEIGNMVSSPEDISALFNIVDDSPLEDTKPQQDQVEDTPPVKEEKENTTKVTEMTAEELFGGSSERVGNEEDDIESEERDPIVNGEGSSPDKLYSSIANSLAEEGALSLLSEDDLNEVKDSESLVAAMKKQVEAMLDDEQRRIKNALDAGLQVPEITQYENIIKYLNNVTDEAIAAENAEGESLRKNLIYQYHINLGMSEAKATKMVERAFAGGTDIEDAKDYLDSLKEHYNNQYTSLIENGKKATLEAKRKLEEDMKKVKETLLKGSNILGDIEVDAKTRQQAFDNWMKPTHRTEDGSYQSEIQKYISDNPTEFQMKVALLFTMTDGFTKMGKVIQQAVKKEKKKAIQELEHTVNNTQRTPSGTINMKGDVMFGGMSIAPRSAW